MLLNRNEPVMAEAVTSKKNEFLNNVLSEMENFNLEEQNQIIKTIYNSIKEKCQIVMLSANEKSVRPLLLNPSTNKLEIPKHQNNYTALEYQEAGYKTFHLYILSNDEIKEGDWYMVISGIGLKLHSILRADDLDSYNNGHCKKIIATTDSSLKISKFSHYSQDLMKIAVYKDYLLPQPSKGFVEKYVKMYNQGKPITGVLVEYEGFIQSTTWEYNEPEWIELKINPKDNTITVYSIKDSWNREEVEELLHKLNNEIDKTSNGHSLDKYSMLKWIDENL